MSDEKKAKSPADRVGMAVIDHRKLAEKSAAEARLRAEQEKAKGNAST